jgi:hypothetical protein
MVDLAAMGDTVVATEAADTEAVVGDHLHQGGNAFIVIIVMGILKVVAAILQCPAGALRLESNSVNHQRKRTGGMAVA